ncbi:CPBP family intramembrane glutamic endopeptidase [Methylomonas sp. MED-D]|uniref:CPBP family intramembrane glutamic endopeptidase n=1 Tax=unclassified Methylomonas TaxID=2608980 RepID=UPI002478AA19|nr:MULTISPECIES: CPBP family intramembrane glutamic endopeptidase [unclassified Methylomonas]MDT4330536.1 CPBP family intramembrane glutamic endopeptidase [Methylomonas sp. MV1]WGS86334.1 CPBP family intramembrane metalloprotease [Methylomonas sp. UP202]
MSDSIPPQDRFFRLACLFEAGLAPLAVLFGWLTDVDPFAGLDWSEPALANGLLATLPLLIVFFALQALEYPALRDIRELLLETLGARLVGRHWSDLLILAGLAGFGEEALFRGFLQPWLENRWGALPALWLSNTVFALVHAVTPLYAVLALLIGLYLGVLLDYGGERNLLMPMVAHAAYDFVAFVVILRDYRHRQLRSQ